MPSTWRLERHARRAAQLAARLAMARRLTRLPVAARVQARRDEAALRSVAVERNRRRREVR